MELSLIDKQSVGLNNLGSRLREIALEVENEFAQEDDEVTPVVVPAKKLDGIAQVVPGEIVEAQFSDGSTFRGVLVINTANENGRLINFELEKSRDFSINEVQSYSILQQDPCAIF